MMQKKIDSKKTVDMIKLVYGLEISRPSILLHTGDDWCWLQYYAIKFLERDCFVFISDKNKDKVKVKTEGYVRVKYYTDTKDLLSKVNVMIKEYTKELEKEIREGRITEEDIISSEQLKEKLFKNG